MSLRFGATARLLAFGLLLLVMSPVTAPFATLDLLDLFGGHAASTSPSGTHKPAQDPQAIASTGPAVGLPALDACVAVFMRPTAGTPAYRKPRVPLRI